MAGTKKKVYTDKIEFEKANQAYNDSLNLYNQSKQDWEKAKSSALKIDGSIVFNNNPPNPLNINTNNKPQYSLYTTNEKGESNQKYPIYAKPTQQPIYQSKIEFTKPEFQDRIDNPAKYDKLAIKNDDGSKSTIKMMSFESDGKYYASPTIFNENGKLKEYSSDQAWKKALDTGNYKQFNSQKEAEEYANNGYKKGTKLENYRFPPDKLSVQYYTAAKALKLQGKPSGYVNEGNKTGRKEIKAEGGWLDRLFIKKADGGLIEEPPTTQILPKDSTQYNNAYNSPLNQGRVGFTTEKDYLNNWFSSQRFKDKIGTADPNNISNQAVNKVKTSKLFYNPDDTKGSIENYVDMHTNTSKRDKKELLKHKAVGKSYKDSNDAIITKVEGQNNPNSISIHELTHLTGLDELNRSKFKGTLYQDKYGNTVPFNRGEAYPSLMQFRYDNNFKPDQIITPEDMKNIRSKGYRNILDDKYTDDEILNYLNTVADNSKANPNQMANGGMIKRADGSYSQRGLWDNIRANKGSGKAPTKQMLEQEKKINSKYANGGWLDGLDNKIKFKDGGTTSNKLELPIIPKSQQQAEAMIQSGQIKVENYKDIEARRAFERSQELKARQERLAKSEAAKKKPLSAQQFADETGAIGDKLRVSQNPNFFDDYINPAVMLGDMASGIGQLPLNIKKGNYGQAALSVAAPLTTGALAGIGAKNTKQFLNNAFNPLAGTKDLVKKSVKPTTASSAAESVIFNNTKNNLSITDKINNLDETLNYELSTLPKKLSSSYQKQAQSELDAGNKWLDDWYNHSATKDKIVTLSEEENLKNFENIKANNKAREAFRNNPENLKYMTQEELNKLMPDEELKKITTEWDNILQNIDNKSFISKFQSKDAKLQKILEGLPRTHKNNYGISGYMLDSDYKGVRQNLVDKYSPKIKSTTIHEGTHGLTDGNYLLPINEQENIVKIFGKNTKIPVRNANGEFNSFEEYLQDPAEVYARINELRAYSGIKPGEIMTDEKFYKLLKEAADGKTPVDPQFIYLIKNNNKFKDLFNRLPVVIPAALGLGSVTQNKKSQGGWLNSIR